MYDSQKIFCVMRQMNAYSFEGSRKSSDVLFPCLGNNDNLVHDLGGYSTNYLLKEMEGRERMVAHGDEKVVALNDEKEVEAG